ncbi:MAG: hypothetical protein ACRD8K_09965, partial [Nitrososphaeraceae archaeon]
MGPVSTSNDDTNNKNDIVRFSAVDYPYNGSIINYNSTSKKFNVFELSKEAGIPISIIEDDRGILWINDHATSIFFTFNTNTNQIKNILHHCHLHGLPVHFHILMNIEMENYGLTNMKEM